MYWKFEDLLDVYFQSEQSPNEKLPTVKYFADKVNLSSNYFGDLIKKETGKTAQEYIQGKIINIAKERILASEKTVSEIAYELGFQYPQHFTRIFKKVVGCTPTEYRVIQVWQLHRAMKRISKYTENVFHYGSADCTEKKW